MTDCRHDMTCSQREADYCRLSLPDIYAECARAHMQGRTAKAENSNKYHAQSVEYDGFKFGSKREAERYMYLRHEERQGRIDSLEVHPAYEFIVNGVKIGGYHADFKYRMAGHWIVEDVKSEATKRARDWPLRKKLMLACHEITVEET